jgi:peptidoglycan/LPS O-acetylase OafA/YrhL
VVALGGTPTRRAPRITYQPALDGLRGLAVLAVLLYHGRVSWMPGGYLGVDAFFVLSGYLITSLLLVEWRERDTIALGAFWGRRARRLLPALALVLIAVVGYAVLLAPVDQLEALRRDAISTTLYFANWRAIFSGHAYMDQFSVPSPLTHTWSLAIEEQWYAVWPLVVLGVLRLRNGGLRALLAVALVGAAASAGWMAWLQRHGADVSRAYYGTDTRAQSLLVGAALAIVFVLHGELRTHAARAALDALALIGIGFTAWLWTTAQQDGHALYRGGYLVAALSIAAVIASSVQPGHGPIGRTLAVEPLRLVGLISYGLYLWHWPVYVVLNESRTGLSGTALLLIRIAVSFAVAIASFVVVERPVRQGVFRLWRPPVLIPAVTTVFLVAIVASTAGGHPTVVLARTGTGPSASADPRLSEGGGSSVANGHAETVLVLGDSVAVTLGPGLAHAGLNVRDYGLPGCGVLPGTPYTNGKPFPSERICARFVASWPQLLRETRPDVVILLSATWDLLPRRVDGRRLRPGTRAWHDFYLSQMQGRIDTLSLSGATVGLVTSPYYKVREGLDVGDITHTSYNPARVDELNADLRELARRNPQRARLIDLNAFACPHHRFTNELNGVSNFRGDGVHFTPAGSDLVGKWLAPQLVVMVTPSPTPTSG